MKPTLFILFLFLLPKPVRSQTVEETYPKTLWCPNDTFVMKFSNYPKSFAYSVSKADKSSPGTDASMGLYTTIYYGRDSIRLYYHNHVPYAHVFFVNLESPTGKTRLRIHYNEFSCYFTKTYADQNRSQVNFEIPEVYELANVIWLLSPNGKRATDLNKEGAYYQEVLRHFTPYASHAIFKYLDIPDSATAESYYDFRENSFAFRFRAENPDSSGLSYPGPFYYIYGKELADSSLFGKLKHMAEDFAKVSKFRAFYKNHRDFYAKEIQRQRELMPVRSMWQWLEKEFPRSKHDAYRIVFSPLIGGSHSTQNYYSKDFKEVVMFVSDAERVDANKQLSEKQKEGLQSGIVFTEIDHNHVNPETRRYKAQVDSIFSKRDVWAKSGNSSNFYGNSSSVFNEYMTWAVFCLYVNEQYDPSTADFIIKKRETIMVERRNFIRFREFDTELIRLRQVHPGITVSELYPFILSWCKTQVKG
jgi:hypothetical protein